MAARVASRQRYQPGWEAIEDRTVCLGAPARVDSLTIVSLGAVRANFVRIRLFNHLQTPSRQARDPGFTVNRFLPPRASIRKQNLAM